MKQSENRVERVAACPAHSAGTNPKPAVECSSPPITRRVLLGALAGALAGLPLSHLGGHLPFGHPAEAAEAHGLAASPSPVVPRALRVVFSGELDGELEPCGCPGGAAGGFPRRVAALTWLKRTQDPWLPGSSTRLAPPLLALDSGNALLKPELTRSRVDSTQQAHARRVGRLLAKSDVKAVAVGVRDLLALEVPGIQALAKETGVRWISANLELGGRLAFPPSLSVQVGGMSVAVVGVTAPHPALEARLGVRIREPLEVLPEQLRGLRARHALVLVLSNQSPEEVTRLGNLPGVDLILSGGPTGGNLQQWGKKPPWGVRVPGAGRSLALVDFRLGLSGDALPDLLPLQLSGSLERRMIELEGHEHALRMLVEQLKQEDGRVNPQRLEVEGAYLRQKLQALEQDPPQPLGSRQFCARLLGLDGSLGEDARVLKSVPEE